MLTENGDFERFTGKWKKGTKFKMIRTFLSLKCFSIVKHQARERETERKFEINNLQSNRTFLIGGKVAIWYVFFEIWLLKLRTHKKSTKSTVSTWLESWKEGCYIARLWQQTVANSPNYLNNKEVVSRYVRVERGMRMCE